MNEETNEILIEKMIEHESNTLKNRESYRKGKKVRK
jgi:hypothetical protein